LPGKRCLKSSFLLYSA